jgi:predicted ATPase
MAPGLRPFTFFHWHGYTAIPVNYRIMKNNNHIPRTDHDDEKDEIKQVKQPFLELEKHARSANERLRFFLMGLSRADMKIRINQLQLSDKSLNFLCEGIALEKEDYEICVAVEEIKKQRAADLLKALATEVQ